MRKILFAVFDKFSHDQRAIETIEALSYLGEVTVVSYDKMENIKNINYVVTGNGNRNYLSFVYSLKKTYKRIKPDFVFLHDNYTAFFIKWIKKKNSKVIVGYDSSELYYDKKSYGIKGIKMNILNHQEFNNIKKADFVFAANIERAMIMKDYFKLSKLPIVWDNIHRIDDDVNISECNKKFHGIIENNKKIIFYCGGIHDNRGTFELINSIEKLGDDYKLIIAGTANDEEKRRFEIKLSQSRTKNFAYIGFLSRSELKYFLKRSLISVSIFDFSCVNHIFCASGKVYESLFEEVPILTSINPPFKRLCDEYGLGVSCTNFDEGIIKIEENYEYYVSNIKKYIKSIDYDKRVNKLRTIIETELNSQEKTNEQ